jgi:hypothetical protein
VFPGRGGRPMSGWSKRVAALREATAAAGLGTWRLHDLRRTARTGLGRLASTRRPPSCCSTTRSATS